MHHISGTWSSWFAWGPCSASCSESSSSVSGTTERIRVCYPYDKQSAAKCGGYKSESEECTKWCPKWSSWSLWSTCKATCSGSSASAHGTRTRTRTCQNSSWKNKCSGSSSDSKQCGKTCHVEGIYLLLINQQFYSNS